jgi:hypothetical protein
MPNMNTMWRDELRLLKINDRKIGRQYQKFAREHNRAILKLQRSLKRGQKAFDKQRHRIETRARILEGRLS